MDDDPAILDTYREIFDRFGTGLIVAAELFARMADPSPAVRLPLQLEKLSKMRKKYAICFTFSQPVAGGEAWQASAYWQPGGFGILWAAP